MLTTRLAIAPRKVGGEVVALIRGRTVQDALSILEHVPRKAAKPVTKLLNSAKANADNNHNMDANTLNIVEITIGPGMRLKRYRPASRGRALPYTRQRSNVLLRVEGKERASSKQQPVAKAKTTKSGVKVSTSKTSKAKPKKVYLYRYTSG